MTNQESTRKERKIKRNGAKELDTLIHDFKEKLEIDLFPYEEAATYLRKVKGNDAYLVFLDELLAPYQ